MTVGAGHESGGDVLSSEDRPKGNGRKLFGAVSVWRDWGEGEAVESDPKYWALFADLLLVAAASAVADGFQEEQNWEGLLGFVLLFSAIIHGWLIYTLHYHSRFLESSLAHSFVLFFYLLGMAGTIVNASVKTAQEFSLGVVVQRVAFLVMIIQVMICLPRARLFATFLSINLLITISLFAAAAMFGGEDNSHLILHLWSAAAVCDYLLGLSLSLLVRGNSLVPLSIDHAKERMSVLVLVMMGETVISATMTYREYKEEGLGTAENEELYYVLLFSFLLVFMFTLLYFHVQPPPEDHALRRSRPAGIVINFLNTILGMTLLMVGVFIKVAVHGAATGTTLKPFTLYLFNVSVGASLVLLLGMRCCHYLGKLPHPSFPIHIQRVNWAWWIVFGLASILPFFFPHWSGKPIPCLIVASVWLTILCIVETSFTHFLGDYVHVPKDSEQKPLTHALEEVCEEHGAKADERSPLSPKYSSTDRYLATKAACLATKVSGPIQHVLVLVSMQSLDRNVVRNQLDAETILSANNVRYKTLDGADPNNKTRRNELFWMSGLTAKYPQFFIVIEDNEQTTTFWGDWDKFQTTNEDKGVAAAFELAVSK